MLYDFLLDLGIITNMAILKWEDQNSYVMQALVVQTNFSRYSLLAIKGFKCLQET